MLLILAPLPLLFGAAVLLVPTTWVLLDDGPDPAAAFLAVWHELEARCQALVELVRPRRSRPARQAPPKAPAARVAWAVSLRSFAGC